MAPMNSGLGMVFLRELLPFVSEGGTRRNPRNKKGHLDISKGHFLGSLWESLTIDTTRYK
jgi:hypothetical protein